MTDLSSGEPIQFVLEPFAESDRGLLLDLAGRLLAANEGDPVRKASLLVGRMPADLPTLIALPPKAKLFGSLVTPDGDQVTILLQASGAPLEIEAFYHAYFLGAGWQLENQLANFERTVYRWSAAHGPRDGRLARVQAEEVQAGITEIALILWKPVVISFQALPHKPSDLHRQNRFNLVAGEIHRLKPPAGGLHLGTAIWGIHQRDPGATARVEADVPLRDLAAHYVAQLGLTGWIPITSGEDDVRAWSTLRAHSAPETSGLRLGFSLLTLPWAPCRYRLDLELLPTVSEGRQYRPDIARSAADRARHASTPLSPDDVEFDPTMFVELLNRSFRHTPRFSHYEGSARIRLLPRRVPGSLSVQVPHPSASHLLGSFETEADGEVQTTVLFTGSCAPDLALAAYRRLLVTQGWRPIAHDALLGPCTGIVDTECVANVFGHAEAPGVLHVGVREDDGGSTELRVSIILDFDAKLARIHESVASSEPEGPALLPSLVPPMGGGQNPCGGSWNHGQAHQRGRMRTGEDIEKVAAHYKAQLRDAGWHLRESGTSESASWSTWTISDAGYRPSEGRLLIVRSPFLPNEYSLEVQRIRHIEVLHPERRRRLWRDSGDVTLP